MFQLIQTPKLLSSYSSTLKKRFNFCLAFQNQYFVIILKPLLFFREGAKVKYFYLTLEMNISN